MCISCGLYRIHKMSYTSRKDNKAVQDLIKKVYDVRPGYREYQNTTLYQDDRCKAWVHVCNVTLENGVKSVNYVSQPCPLNKCKFYEDKNENYKQIEEEIATEIEKDFQKYLIDGTLKHFGTQ